MVEIRRDSLTGNFLDRTVIDTLVLDLGNNNSKEDVEATVKKTLKKRFSDSEITSNRNLRHGDDKEEDRYNYEICEQDVSTDRLLMLIGDRNEIQFANTDKKVPREEEEEGLFGPPSSFSTHPTTSYMSYDKNKPLARRGSIKFDYDNVDYDNPLASYEEENEYYDSDYYPDRPLRIDQVIGQESLQEEDHHLRSSTDPIYAQLLQYNMSSFKQERKESDNEEEEEEQEQDEEEDKQQQQQQERSLRRKVRNLKLDDVNKKKEEKLKQQRKSL